jgi:hypothetical protein
MATQDTELYRKVLEAMDELLELMKALDQDDPQRSELRDQRNQLRRERNRILARAIDEASAEYAKATAALDLGIRKIQAAKDNLDKLADVLAKVSQAIEFVAKVAAA